MEAMLLRGNLTVALERVRRNAGSPGIDGMEPGELLPYLWEHWEAIKASLLDGTYRPQPVLRQEIPKAGGGVRELGIPTVLDRFIQQAPLQVLQPRFDPTFSNHSYGFRPGRRAHDAICHAQRHVEDGRRIVPTVIEELRSFLHGWHGYFRLTNLSRPFIDLDGWIRRRLRVLYLKHWKRGRATYRELRARGASDTLASAVACHDRRWWRHASKRIHHVLNNAYFDGLGLPRLAK